MSQHRWKTFLSEKDLSQYRRQSSHERETCHKNDWCDDGGSTYIRYSVAGVKPIDTIAGYVLVVSDDGPRLAFVNKINTECMYVFSWNKFGIIDGSVIYPCDSMYEVADLVILATQSIELRLGDWTNVRNMDPCKRQINVSNIDYIIYVLGKLWDACNEKVDDNSRYDFRFDGVYVVVLLFDDTENFVVNEIRVGIGISSDPVNTVDDVQVYVYNWKGLIREPSHEKSEIGYIILCYDVRYTLYYKVLLITEVIGVVMDQFFCNSQIDLTVDQIYSNDRRGFTENIPLDKLYQIMKAGKSLIELKMSHSRKSGQSSCIMDRCHSDQKFYSTTKTGQSLMELRMCHGRKTGKSSCMMDSCHSD